MSFHVFDRYEIHIQAFVHFIDGKLIISNPHLRQKNKGYVLKIPETKKEKLWYLGHTIFENVRVFLSPISTNIICFQDDSIIFLYPLKHFGNS